MGVADHEGDGHGLAQRATQPQHEAADDADAGEGQDDVAEHFPGRAANAVGRFLQHRRHRVEHVACEIEVTKGSTMMARISRRGQQADAVGWAFEQDCSGRECHWNASIMNGCMVRLQERREDEQAPDAVDDAGDAGQQFHRHADRAPQRASGKAR